MVHVLSAIVAAVFIWWFTTGALLFLTSRSKDTFGVSMAAASVVAMFAAFGLWLTAQSETVWSIYGAFLAGVLLWGWLELVFYLGFVTGPRTSASEPGCSDLRHFWHGVETCLSHQLLTFVVIALVAALTLPGENQVGLWTFLTLYAQQQSAKLNVFFGVRNLNAQFLPDHLAYLRHFLKERPLNLFFPVSVTVSTVVLVLVVSAAAAAQTDAQMLGLTLLATLLGLAILEHWFLVLPLPAEKLWTWSQWERPAAVHSVVRPGVDAVPIASPGAAAAPTKVELAS
ncbi:MAG: putative photosynthetic complex assembly protein PuhE [Pseudomonadota bacterium]